MGFIRASLITNGVRYLFGVDMGNLDIVVDGVSGVSSIFLLGRLPFPIDF